jgi:hypothetical protein
MNAQNESERIWKEALVVSSWYNAGNWLEEMCKLIKTKGEWKELYNEGIYNLYPLTHIISDETKENKMEGTCSSHSDDERCGYSVWEKLENKGTISRQALMGE